MNRTKRFIIGLTILVAFTAFANLTFAAPDANEESVVVPRVARISYIEGPATMQRTTDDEWTDAAINLPLMIGDKIYSGVGGRVEVQLEDDTVVRLGGDTYIHFANLEDALTRIGVMKGTVSVHAKNVEYTRAPIEIKSKFVHARINEWANARFNIDENGFAEVMVRRGRLDVDRGGDGFFYLRRGDQLKITGPDPASFTLQVINPEDGFDQWCDMRDAMRASSITAKYLSTRVAGYSDLDYYGDWIEAPEYGRVWRPRVVVDDWAPYRDGRWVWRDHCGWVWVSYEPWGWAPYHYGRWVYVKRHWCWAPHSEIIVVGRPRHYHWPRPVWYPSLVSFTYARHGRYFSFSVGGHYYDGPCVGWFPLGPYDRFDYWRHYRPRHHGHGHRGPGGRGPGHGDIIAAGDVTINNGIINNNTTIYQNQAAPNALSVMPQRDFGTSMNTKPARANLNPSHIRENQVAVGPETGLKISPPRQVVSKSENTVLMGANAPARAKTSQEAKVSNRGLGKAPRQASVMTSAKSAVSPARTSSAKTKTTAVSAPRATVESKSSPFERPSVINDVKRTTSGKQERSNASVQTRQNSAPRMVEIDPSKKTATTNQTVSPSRSASGNMAEQRNSVIRDSDRSIESSRTENRTRQPLTRDYSSNRTSTQTNKQTSTSPSRSRFNYERDTRKSVITTPSRSSRSSSSDRSPYVVIPRSNSSSSTRESSRSSAFSSPSYNPPRTIETQRSSSPSRSSLERNYSSPSRSSGGSNSNQSTSPSRSSSYLNRDYQSSGSSNSSSNYRSTSPSRSSSSSSRDYQSNSSSRSSSSYRSSSPSRSSASSRSSSSYRSSSSSRSSVSPSRSSSSVGRSSSSSGSSSSRSISPSRSSSSSSSRSTSPARSSRSSGSTSSPRRR